MKVLSILFILMNAPLVTGLATVSTNYYNVTVATNIYVGGSANMNNATVTNTFTVSGTANLGIANVTNALSVSGSELATNAYATDKVTADFFGNISYGSSTLTLPGVFLSYTDSNHTIQNIVAQSNSIFLWQDGDISGTPKNKLKLDGSNNLSLVSTNGYTNIFLNPNTGSITNSGNISAGSLSVSGILNAGSFGFITTTGINADSIQATSVNAWGINAGGVSINNAGITLADSTVISGASSLHSSGLYNSSGTEVAYVDGSGNLDLTTPVQVVGSGNGINFANGSSLNAGNVAYLNQTLTNLGYQPNTIPPDTYYNLPNNFSIYNVAVDGSGNTYITGTLKGSGTVGPTTLTAFGFADVFVIKLNASGVPQWAQNFGGGSRGVDNPNGITVDQYGNVSVVGSYTAPITNGLNGQTLNTSGGADVFVVSYNSSGTVQWATGFGGGNDYPISLASDSSGNVDVTGYYGSPITTGLPAGSGPTVNGQGSTFLVQYNRYGGLNWAQGFGANNAWPLGVALDGSGNIYVVAGYTPDSSSGDVLVAKYNNAGLQQWEETFGGGADDPIGIAVDQSGNAYVLGSYYNPISDGFALSAAGGADEFLVKYNSNGAEVTAAGFGSGTDYPQAIGADGSGNIFVTGENYGTFTLAGKSLTAVSLYGGGDLFVAEFNSSLVPQWANDYGTPVGGFTFAQSIAVTPSGALSLTGFGNGSFDIGNQALSTVGTFVYIGSEASLATPVTEAAPSFSWGGSRASGSGAVALGTYASATSSGSVALGDSVSSGNYSLSAGYLTKAGGSYAVSFGEYTTASGTDSTAFGNGSTASGQFSTTFGSSTLASGSITTAFGVGTKAASYASFALGSYNVGLVGTTNGLGGSSTWIPTDPVLEIGNGTSYAHGNALTVFKNGNLRAAGTVESPAGFRSPQTGDMSMGSFTNGNTPSQLSPTNGLTYPGGN